MSEGKSFDRLLIEIGTDTGDLGKTIQDLEKLQKFMKTGEKGSDFKGLKDAVKEAVKEQLGAKASSKGGTGGGTGDIGPILANFTSQTSAWMNEMRGLFGGKRTTGHMWYDEYARKYNLDAADIVDQIQRMGPNEGLDSAKELIASGKFSGFSPEALLQHSKNQLIKMVTFFSTGIGTPSKEYDDMMQRLVKTGQPSSWFSGRSGTPNIEKAARLNDRAERYYQATFAKAMREKGINVQREVGVRPLTTGSEEDVAQFAQDFKDLAKEMHIVPGSTMTITSASPQAIDKLKRSRKTNKLTISGEEFDLKAISSAWKAIKKGGGSDEITRARDAIANIHGTTTSEGSSRLDELFEIPEGMAPDEAREALLDYFNIPKDASPEQQDEILARLMRGIESGKIGVAEFKKGEMTSGKAMGDIRSRTALDPDMPLISAAPDYHKKALKDVLDEFPNVIPLQISEESKVRKALSAMSQERLGAGMQNFPVKSLEEYIRRELGDDVDGKLDDILDAIREMNSTEQEARAYQGDDEDEL